MTRSTFILFLAILISLMSLFITAFVDGGIDTYGLAINILLSAPLAAVFTGIIKA